MTIIDVEKFDPSIEPNGDKVHRLVRTALGALPLFSGAALEVLNSLVEDPYNSRRTKWLHELSRSINDLTIDIEKIKSDSIHNNIILSAIIQATDIAIKTGDNYTHQLLINLILKTIKSQDSNEELNSVYLSTIRQLTSSHLALLNLIGNRKRYERGHELNIYEPILFDEISSCDKISQSIPPSRLLNDLVSMQLIYSPPSSPWSSGMTNYCTMTLSEFAIGFIEYITKA